LPSDAFLVAKIDLVRLRESASWDAIAAAILVVEESASRTLPSLANGELRRWVSVTDRVWIALTPSSRFQADAFSVVEGRFSAADAASALTALGGDDRLFVPREGSEPPTFDGEAPLEEVALLDDGLGVSATSHRLAEVVARRLSPQSESPLAGGELATMAHRVNFPRDAIGVAVVFTPEAKAAIGPRLDARIRAVLDVATAGALRVGLNEGIDALAIVSTTDERAAAVAVGHVEQQRAMLSQQPVVYMMGLAPLVNGIGANAEGGDIRLSLRASQEDTQNLLGRLSGFLGLAIAALLEDS
jgi:hypothetical protein